MITEQMARYELPARELADWLEKYGSNNWWSVDGDPLLMGRLDFPCPADELAAELRRIDAPLQVSALQTAVRAPAGPVTAGELDELAKKHGPGDRILRLRWSDSDNDWMLVEDSESTLS